MTADRWRAYFIRHPSSATGFEWRWPNFRFEELECRDGTGLLLVPVALDHLQALRNRIGGPIIVHSAYRSIAYNKVVGGADGSYHLSGLAFDISSPVVSLPRLRAAAIEGGFTGIGKYRTFVHVDLGPRRHWEG